MNEANNEKNKWELVDGQPHNMMQRTDHEGHSMLKASLQVPIDCLSAYCGLYEEDFISYKVSCSNPIQHLLTTPKPPISLFGLLIH